MAKLRDIQDRFENTILRKAGDLPDAANDLRDLFISDHIDIKDRMSVYHNNVIGSVSNALAATFPLLNNLVGEAFLKSTARAFVIENPPKAVCMHHYGDGFDNFIRGFEPAKNYPYLGDVAAFEYAMNAAYYAYDDDALTPASLEQIPAEDLHDIHLHLRKSAHLIASPYPLGDIRRFCLNETTEQPDLSGMSAYRALILRPAMEVEIIALNQGEFDFLSYIQNDKKLGAALEHTLSAHPDFDFMKFLKRHLTLETFCALPPN